MLLSGQEGGLSFLEPGELDPSAAGCAPPRMAAGRGSSMAPARGGDAAAAAAPAPPPSQEEAAAADVRRSAVETVERAFFDALAEGLRRGKASALASLLLDSRDQLAALLPQHPPPGSGGASGGRGGGSKVGGEGAELLAELREKLDTVRAGGMAWWHGGMGCAVHGPAACRTWPARPA